MSEFFQPETSGATPDKPSDSEPVPLDKTRDALRRRLPREQVLSIYYEASKRRRLRHLRRIPTVTSDDLVDEAIDLLMKGKRHWYPENDLKKTILDIVDSLASQYLPRNWVLRLKNASDDNDAQKIIDNFKKEFISKKKERIVLVVHVVNNNTEKWTIKGFNDLGAFHTVVLNDSSHELLLKMLKNTPDKKKKIFDLATSILSPNRMNNYQEDGAETSETFSLVREMENSGDEFTELAEWDGEMEGDKEAESTLGKSQRKSRRASDQPDFLTPERVILRESKRARLRDGIFQLFEGDPLAIRFIHYGLEHPDDVKPRKVAPALGITIEEFNNLQKRLRRKRGAINMLRQEVADDPEPQPNPRTLNFP